MFFSQKRPHFSFSNSIYDIALFLLWLVAVLWISTYHEFWRDEVRALSIATSADGLGELPALLVNEGHPSLWYVILHISQLLLGSPIALKVSALLVAAISILIFLFFSPYGTWQKALFIFGYLPFYEYAVFARNYGISMLFMFAFTAIYSSVKYRPVLLSIILFLLANTNIHSLIIVMLFCAIWIYEKKQIIFRLDNIKMTIWHVIALLIISIGVIFCISTTVPEATSLVTKEISFQLEVRDFVHKVFSAMVYPGEPFNSLFRDPLLKALIPFLLIASLMPSPHRALSLYLGFIAFSLFFLVIYPGSIRHQGILYCFILCLLWMHQKDAENKYFGSERLKSFLFKLQYWTLNLLLIVQLYAGSKHVLKDVNTPLSSSKDFSEFVMSIPAYNNALIVGEPDVLLESLHYYLPNSTYLLRETKFKRYVSFTTEAKRNYSMHELLADVENLSADKNVPILVLISTEIFESKKKIHEHSYGKIFRWTDDSIDLLHSKMKKVAEFNKSTTENFIVFEWTPNTQ